MIAVYIIGAILFTSAVVGALAIDSMRAPLGWPRHMAHARPAARDARAARLEGNACGGLTRNELVSFT